MSDTKFGKDIFVALAATPWADGRLDPGEADAIVGATVDEGVTLGDRPRQAQASRRPPNGA